MIKNLIFDIGNVLTDFRWREFIMEKGYTREEMEKIGEVTVHTPYWPEFDRGVWPEEKIMASFVALAPELEKDIHKCFDDFTGMVTMRDYAIHWIEEIKAKGFKTYYLSNYPEKAYIQCEGALDFIPYMDGGILSYRDQVIKPYPEIYKLLLERYNLKADECIFMDDNIDNVNAAKAVGIEAIQFTTKEKAIEDLKKYGVML